METNELIELLLRVVKLPKESEWVEFKENNSHPEEIGETISALSNGACLHNQPFGYLVYGVENETQKLKGTSFTPQTCKKGNEELENWITQRLNPKIDFRIYEFDYDGMHFAIFEIPCTTTYPVTFLQKAYIRIGGYKKNLHEFPEKEKKIWAKCSNICFEDEIALSNVTVSDILNLLDFNAVFALLKLPTPSKYESIIEYLISIGLVKNERKKFSITNLGGILFAKDLKKFPTLSRKAIRVMVYEGTGKEKIKIPQEGVRGYAAGYEGLIKFINLQLPTHEKINGGLRETITTYPINGIRELVANALIHQDFSERGTSPVIEIFSDRIEITNPGRPLIKPLRFIDAFQSRNEKLAALMRRMRICEEMGTGVDRVIYETERKNLPAPQWEENGIQTKVIMFGPKKFKDINIEDRIRACYQHCVIRYLANARMTNTTLRERFNIDPRNSAMVSTVIANTIKASLIKDDDAENDSKKFAKYKPFWA